MGTDILNMPTLREPDEAVLIAELDRALHPLTKPPALVLALRQQLQDVMWDEVGVIRNAHTMQRGISGISDVSNELMDVGVASDNLAFNLTWHDWLNMRSLCDVSEVITQAGIARENSRGAHYRDDFPEAGNMKDSEYTVVKMEGEGIKVTRDPVQFTIVSLGQTVLPDQQRETVEWGEPTKMA